MERKLITTEDGSHTYFVPALNEHYHSTFGAVSESKHIFIEHALNAAAHKYRKLRILEVGFGTGLNALLTCLECLEKQIRVHYTAIEPWPIDLAEAMKLNYAGMLHYSIARSIFRALHESPWDASVDLSEQMKILKMRSKFEDTVLAPGQFNVVYFDAFGPEAQPELWTEEIFSKLYASMARGACMTTFSAKGAVRRAVVKAGFEVERLEGPPGKREMTRVWKPTDNRELTTEN
jgi:tRNA U34 5-methylaminomethyl-2-thiouridine-forming methyltransferase MnmC